VLVGNPVLEEPRGVTLCGAKSDGPNSGKGDAEQSLARPALGGRTCRFDGGFPGCLDGLANLAQIGRSDGWPGAAGHDHVSQRKGRTQGDPWIGRDVASPVSHGLGRADNAPDVLMEIVTDFRHLAPNLVNLGGSYGHGVLLALR
jgi:hypothetical protein